MRPAELSHFIRQAVASIHEEIELIEPEAPLELDHEELIFRFRDPETPAAEGRDHDRRNRLNDG